MISRRVLNSFSLLPVPGILSWCEIMMANISSCAQKLNWKSALQDTWYVTNYRLHSRELIGMTASLELCHWDGCVLLQVPSEGIPAQMHKDQVVSREPCMHTERGVGTDTQSCNQPVYSVIVSIKTLDHHKLWQHQAAASSASIDSRLISATACSPMVASCLWRKLRPHWRVSRDHCREPITTIHLRCNSLARANQNHKYRQTSLQLYWL